MHDDLQSIDNPLEKIIKYLDITVNIFISRPEATRMFIVDINQIKNVSVEGVQFDSYFNNIDYIKDLCDEAIEKGFIRKMDGKFLALTIFACIDYIVRLWIYSGHNADIETLKENMKNILIYGIIKY